MIEQGGKVRIVPLILDDETCVYGNITSSRRHRDGVRVTSETIVDFVDSNVMGFVEEPSTTKSSYAASNDRDFHQPTTYSLRRRKPARFLIGNGRLESTHRKAVVTKHEYARAAMLDQVRHFEGKIGRSICSAFNLVLGYLMNLIVA